MSEANFWATEMGNSREVSLLLSVFISRLFRTTWMGAFGHSINFTLNIYFLHTFNVPGTALGPGEMVMNKRNIVSSFVELGVKSRCRQENK